MICACQAIREDIERIKHDTEVKKTVAHVKTNIKLKQNPVREPPSLLHPHTALSFSHSHSFLSFILSFCPYWAAKLSLSFTAYPGRKANNASTLCSPEYVLETQSGPLIPHVLFFLFSFTLLFSGGKVGENLNRLAVKANSSLFSLFFFPAVSLCQHKHTHWHIPHFPVWV